MSFTPSPWQRGITLITRETERWSKEEIARNDEEERLRIFTGFRADDQGRSRQLICTVHPGEHAEANAALITVAPELYLILKKFPGLNCDTEEVIRWIRNRDIGLSRAKGNPV